MRYTNQHFTYLLTYLLTSVVHIASSHSINITVYTTTLRNTQSTSQFTPQPFITLSQHHSLHHNPSSHSVNITVYTTTLHHTQSTSQSTPQPFITLSQHHSLHLNPGK